MHFLLTPFQGFIYSIEEVKKSILNKTSVKLDNLISSKHLQGEVMLGSVDAIAFIDSFYVAWGQSNEHWSEVYL